MLGADGLRACGLSRAKASYLLDLADRQARGLIDIDHLEGLSDIEVMAELTAVHGVGPWTAEMYLILQLRRPDVLPAGDLGIRNAIQAAWDLPAMPSISQTRDRATAWVPFRSYAVRLLWTSLLSGGD